MSVPAENCSKLFQFVEKLKYDFCGDKGRKAICKICKKAEMRFAILRRTISGRISFDQTIEGSNCVSQLSVIFAPAEEAIGQRLLFEGFRRPIR